MPEHKEIVVAEQGGQIATRPDDRGWLSTVDLTMRMTKVKEVMATVMQPGIHYGKIPGCPKPSLFQPGAEVLGTTFRLAPRFKHEQRWRGNIFEDFCTCELYDMNGNFVGDSSRVCSTDEEKYAWRSSKCPEEYKATPAELKRTTWKKDSQDKWYEAYQIRTNPGDLLNTITGMSEKRSYVGAIRRATAASEVFTEGIENLPADILQVLMEEDDDPELVRKVSAVLNRLQNPGMANAAKPAQRTPQSTATAAPGSPGAFVITFGKNQGKTLAEVGERSASWYAENAREDDLKAAAKAYIDSLHGTPASEPAAPAQPSAPVSGDANAEPPEDFGDMPDISDPFKDQ
ncbi:MAG: hypothetical protein ACYDCO_25550 [Armatimonadota bacterium]